MCARLHELWTYSIPQVQLQQAKEHAGIRVSPLTEKLENQSKIKSYIYVHMRALNSDANWFCCQYMEETQEKEEPIHSDVEVVKQQLEAHKVRVTASSSNYSVPVPYPFLSLGSNHHTNKHWSALV